MAFRNGRKVSIPYLAAGTAVASTLIPYSDVGGKLVEVKVNIPNCANDVTFTFSILDEEGDTTFAVAALARNAATMSFSDRIIQRGYKYAITASGATGTAITVVLSPTYEV